MGLRETIDALFAKAAGERAPAAAPSGKPGAYRIGTLNAAGQAVGGDIEEPLPHDETAVQLLYGFVDASKEPPADQLELQIDLGKVETTVRRLLLESGTPQPIRFRLYYVRLFMLAQLGLETPALPGAARRALDEVVTDLIDEEAGRIKNAHLHELGRNAITFAMPFALGYFLLSSIAPGSAIARSLESLAIALPMLRAFMMLWIGCFLGVWLSYGIRTVKFTLADLTRTDADRLRPALRLMFAGLLTMLLGILFTLGVVEIKIGGFAITAIADYPMLAFVVGAFCGISEISLPNALGKRAAGFAEKL